MNIETSWYNARSILPNTRCDYRLTALWRDLLRQRDTKVIKHSLVVRPYFSDCVCVCRITSVCAYMREEVRWRVLQRGRIQCMAPGWRLLVERICPEHVCSDSCCRNLPGSVRWALKSRPLCSTPEIAPGTSDFGKLVSIFWTRENRSRKFAICNCDR